ncbi:metallophosphoesterase [Ekhidna sp. To15]|uniref:metallophosphoesterase n=1 Tax=Ekhidna sp. To15 TaxID=3395267 RepID=UPI003F51C429
MKKAFLLTCAITLALHGLFSQDVSINDGPYIFIADDELMVKNVKAGEVLSTTLALDAFETSYAPQKSIFTDVTNIVALSDIHGQYDLAVEILQNNGIIDEELNWDFGNGHMVIAGDIFDRGPQVTEVLWLVYRLEKQAKEAGGFVHFLLGNHEYMVLHKDLRYLHEKYETVSMLLDMDYDDLFGSNTILGRWLRSKPTIVKINEHVFVHGGISNDFLSSVGFDIENINETMRKSIDRSKDEMKASDFYSTYYGSSGPIWYRGYFYGELSDQAIDSVLNRTTSEHVVVGHCSNDEVVSLFDNKIFGVDSSIKKGQYGEVLFLSGDSYYRGTKDGEKLKFE